MSIRKTVLAGLFAVVVLGAAAPAFAKDAISWDGSWAGKWDGPKKSPGKVVIKGNKVIAYYFRGEPQTVGATSVSGKSLSFGSGYTIKMTLTGDNAAHAVWKGDGSASAELTR